MKLLIIGGTRFLGRALVRAARERGHQITLFNRGKSNPGLFPEIEQVTGDRMTDLSLLHGRQWDAVIDTCGYEPAALRLSAGADPPRGGAVPPADEAGRQPEAAR